MFIVVLFSAPYPTPVRGPLYMPIALVVKVLGLAVCSGISAATPISVETRPGWVALSSTLTMEGCEVVQSSSSPSFPFTTVRLSPLDMCCLLHSVDFSGGTTQTYIWAALRATCFNVGASTLKTLSYDVHSCTHNKSTSYKHVAIRPQWTAQPASHHFNQSASVAHVVAALAVPVCWQNCWVYHSRDY
jgi:hypothetical protein